MDYLLSIIVPIYNSENYLDKCLQSIINQTYSNLEILLIDDGSKDNSLKICNEYALKDQRIKVIHKTNNGAAAARNTGLDIASGDYVAFVDSDDYIDVNMYEKMMEINEKYDCDIVMCDCYKEKSESKFIFTHNIREGYYDKNMLYKEYFPTLLMTNTVDYPPTISNWTCLIKKEIIDKYNLRYKEGMRFSEDLLFGSQAIYFAESFYYMKLKPFYHYVFHQQSVTSTYYENKWSLMKQLYDEIKSFFLSVDDYDFKRQVDLSLLFIVYHCIGNIKGSSYSNKEKTKKIMEILNNNDTEMMFRRLNINSLDISWKQKILTYIFKYKIKFLLLI